MSYQILRLVALFHSFLLLVSEHIAEKISFSVCFSFQNIKKLLKIPYSKSHVSMAVHRVGRTLLLDELDTQELLRRSSQVQGDVFR